MDTDFFTTSAFQTAQHFLHGLANTRGACLLNEVFSDGAAARYYSSALFADPDPLHSIGITILNDEILHGHPAAFTKDYVNGTPEIFLNSSWLATASRDSLTGVLLEEFGHAIDWVVNREQDTAGDEGLRFSNLLMADHGLNYSALGRPIDDHGTITCGLTSYQVEFSTSPTAGFTSTGIITASWSSTTSGLFNNGSVNTASAPTSILINGSNAVSIVQAETVDYTTTSVITGPGFAIYNWTYTKNDPSTSSDSFGSLVNGSYSQLSSNSAGSESKNGQLSAFFSTPTSFGFRALSNDGLSGNIVASVSAFKFKLIAEAYALRFNQLFSATGSGTAYNTVNLLSQNIWILPDDPLSDSDFTTNFANNGSGAFKRVWLISPDVNGGQPMALYLTNGQNTVGVASTAEDLWVFSDGLGASYILTSGGYTTTSSNSSLPSISSSIALSDLDQLYSEQGDTVPPTAASVSLSDWRLKIGDSTRLTIVFSEEVRGLNNSNFSTIVSHPNLIYTSGSLFTTNNITWTADFTPSSSTEDSTNVVSVDVSQISDVAGNAGANTASRISSNYTVDTIRPELTGIYFSVAGGVQALTRPILNGERPYLYFKFTESVWNLGLSDLDVTGGLVSGLEVCNPVTGAVAAGTESTSTLYRVRFTPSNINSNSIPVWARLRAFSDRSETNSQGNLALSSSSPVANLRFSIDNAKPFATFKSPPTTMSLGSVKAIQIELSEASPDFGLASLKVTGSSYVAGFRKLSNTLYEILLVATRYVGDFTLSIIPESFQDVNGNKSMANKQFLDVVRIKAR